MPGAGGLLSANHLFRVAKPDGLTIGHFVVGQILQQLLGRPGIEFEALKNLITLAFRQRVTIYSALLKQTFRGCKAGRDSEKSG